MPDQNRPGEAPPDYAEAYRRGYETAHERRPAGDGEPEPTTRLESLDSAFVSVEPDEQQAGEQYRGHDDERRRIMAPLGLLGLALLLVVGAYALGRLFASTVGDVETSSSEPDGVVIKHDGSGSGDHQSSGKDAYAGPLDPTAIGGAAASCQSENGVDAAGHPVSYAPSNIYDGRKSTAWRCDGDGVGERVTINLPGETTIGQVGLVPGYAKTDPASGVDRYSENNRLTRVRWLFSDGSSVTQKLNGAPRHRALQTMRVPETATSRVVIEILSSVGGPRNTVAVSEVAIGEVAG